MSETLIKEPETEVSVTVSNGIYARYIKRFMDFFLSFCAVIVLSPILMILTAIGAVVMKGNPFFIQKRPGMIDKKTGKERILSLVKFRTMTNERDSDGNLLPDEKRLVPYGKFLRSSSLDELPSLINILVGSLSIVGPRPLLVEYLPWYTEEERHRHDVRPGLTGWAQVNGRNSVDWDRRLQLDLEYVSKITLAKDIKIIFLTVKKVLSKSDISENTRETEGNFADIRRAEAEHNQSEIMK